MSDLEYMTEHKGGFLPFGRKLASQDEGASWIGSNNVTPFRFLRSQY